MKIDLGRLSVAEVVVHEVLAGKEKAGTNLSEVVDDPGEETRAFFKQRVVSSLTEAGRAIVLQDKPKSPVPKLISGILGDAGMLLGNSQDCAGHLAKCQTSGAISAGLMCVSVGRLAKTPAVTIVKLEIEEGVRLKRTKVGGKASLSMQSVKDLMLSERTRVFKVGLFYREDGVVRGLVSDHQVPRTSVRGVARFFLEEFLGCQLEELPEITTGRYYEAVSDFANSMADTEKRYRYDAALHADLLSNASSVEPGKFARRHLDQGDRAEFFRTLKERRLDQSGFEKDLGRIESQIRKRRIDFKSGLHLTGPTGSFDEHVNVDGKKNAVTVLDEIVKVGFRT